MKEKTRLVRYFNASGIATGIVEVANWYKGMLFDWALYIGATTDTQRAESCMKEVARHGCKMSREDAAHFCPSLPIGRYRE